MSKPYASAALLLGCLLAASGCGRSPKVKVYPVKGTVVSKGGIAVAGGSISFQAVNDTQSSVVGVIKDDGSFSLHTLVRDAKVEGAAEGTYKVTVMPPLPADHKTMVNPIALNKTFEVKPGENEFRIEVEPPRRR
jgi:hypothetical protein